MEYGLLLGLLAVALVAVLFSTGRSVAALFDSVRNRLPQLESSAAQQEEEPDNSALVLSRRTMTLPQDGSCVGATLRNAGAEPALYPSFQPVGGDAPFFSYCSVADSPQTDCFDLGEAGLLPGASCSFGFSSLQTSAGTLATQVQWQSGEATSATLTVSGTRDADVPPVLVYAEELMYYGTRMTVAGTATGSTCRPLQLTNYGGPARNIQTQIVSGGSHAEVCVPPASDAAQPCDGSDLGYGQSCLVGVIAAGTQDGNLPARVQTTATAATRDAGLDLTVNMTGYSRSCDELYRAFYSEADPSNASTLYFLYPNGPQQPVYAYCYMEPGAGLTLVSSLYGNQTDILSFAPVGAYGGSTALTYNTLQLGGGSCTGSEAGVRVSGWLNIPHTAVRLRSFGLPAGVTVMLGGEPVAADSTVTRSTTVDTLKVTAPCTGGTMAPVNVTLEVTLQ